MKALGPKSKTPWLAKRDGPAPQDKFITVAGERYVMNSFCKNHDCNNNSAVLLYSPEKKAVYGTIYEKGKTTYIGDPPGPVAAELGETVEVGVSLAAEVSVISALVQMTDPRRRSCALHSPHSCCC